MGISSTGEMAVLLHSRSGVFSQFGTLARMPLAGGAPREILDQVNWADWSPDGANLAIVRQQGGFYQLEYPIGKVLYKTSGLDRRPANISQGRPHRVYRPSHSARRWRHD